MTTLSVLPARTNALEVSAEEIELAVLGEPDATRHVVEALRRPVLASIHRFLGRGFAHEVEDIGQDVLLKILRNLHRFDPHRGVKLTTWVFIIVKNHCFDLFKKRRIKTFPFEANAKGEDTRHEPEAIHERKPLDRVVNTELGRQIDDALQRLAPHQRKVFVLREYEGLEYGAIARITRTPEGTVKSQLHRAKQALRARLKPYLRAASRRQEGVGGARREAPCR